MGKYNGNLFSVTIRKTCEICGLGFMLGYKSKSLSHGVEEVDAFYEAYHTHVVKCKELSKEINLGGNLR